MLLIILMGMSNKRIKCERKLTDRIHFCAQANQPAGVTICLGSIIGQSQKSNRQPYCNLINKFK